MILFGGEMIYIKSSDTTITKYSLQDNTSQVVFTSKDPERKIMDFAIGNSGNLYVTLALPYNIGNARDFQIVESNLSTGNVLRTISPKMQGMLMKYLFEAGDTEIIIESSGDGCVSYGNISRFQNNSMIEITDYGVGCTNKPRYLGFDESANKLIMASIISYTSGNDIKEDWDVLYTQNVLNGEINPIYDLKIVPDLRKLILSDDKNKVALISTTGVSVLDLNSKTVTKKITYDFKNVNNFQWRLQNNNLIGVKALQMSVISLEAGKVMEFEAPRYSSAPLGVFNNGIILLSSDRE